MEISLLALFLKAIIARSCSLKIGVKIVKFTSNYKKKYFHLEHEVNFQEYAALNIIYAVANPVVRDMVGNRILDFFKNGGSCTERGSYAF